MLLKGIGKANESVAHWELQGTFSWFFQGVGVQHSQQRPIEMSMISILSLVAFVLSHQARSGTLEDRPSDYQDRLEKVFEELSEILSEIPNLGYR